MGNANVILIGKTGVGKSTLINAILGKNVAKEGVGECTTKGVNKYAGISCYTNHPVCLYDTEGFELNVSQRNKSVAEIKEMIRKCLNSGVHDIIQTVWYCINVQNGRVDNEEIGIIKEIIDQFNLTVIVVLTQAIDKRKVGKIKQTLVDDEIVQSYLNNKKIGGICDVVAKRMEITDDKYIKEKGLLELEKITVESIALSTVNIYMKNVHEMTQKAKKYASWYVKTTVITGFSPIPFSDMAVLIPTQVAMLVHINQIYGMSIKGDILRKIAEVVIRVGGASLVGKSLVSNIFKYVPGIGTVVGGMISGSVAGVITSLLAQAYIVKIEKRKMEDFYNVLDDEDNFSDDVIKAFKERM